MSWLLNLFKREPKTVTGETKAEFLADVERHNKAQRESNARVNAAMQTKWEKQWDAQYEKERRFL